jgi:hypothetical protein
MSEYKFSPRDAWGFTMHEYNELCSVKSTKPAERIYDQSTQERLIARHEVRRIING